MNSTVKFLASITLTAALVAGVLTPAQAAQIMMGGSGGMLPMANGLVRAFKAKNPSTPPFEVSHGTNSAVATRDVAEGRLDIGLSSRPLSDAERAAGLHSVEIARAPVLFAVHISVKVSGLTTQQVCDIYAGKIKNWKEVGGTDLSILPLSRPADETDTQIIKKLLACFKEGEGVPSLAKASDMAKALASKAGAIGFTNLTIVDKSQGAVRPLVFNGISAVPANLQNGSYPLVRQFFLVTKGAPAGPIAQFVAFVKGPDGARVIREDKAVPVK